MLRYIDRYICYCEKHEAIGVMSILAILLLVAVTITYYAMPDIEMQRCIRELEDYKYCYEMQRERLHHE